jgi:hypothetical protein
VSRRAPCDLKLSPRMAAAMERHRVALEAKAEAERDRPYAVKRAKARQSAMERYVARDELQGHQIEAARLFEADERGSGLHRRVTGRYEVSSGRSSPSGFSPGPRFLSWVRVVRALDQIDFSLLYTVVIEGHGANVWALKSGRHARDGMGYLRSALDRLAVHYKLASARELVVRAAFAKPRAAPTSGARKEP